jgi:LysM repeat protein
MVKTILSGHPVAPDHSRKRTCLPLSISMKNQKFFMRQSFVISNIVLAAVFGFLRAEAAGDGARAPSETTTPNTALFELINAAKYSKEDKETLKSGLSVAIASMTNESIVRHVSQETIDTQIKKSLGDYNATVAFIFAVAKQFEDKSSEFTKSDTFQHIPAADRDVVLSYLKEVTEYYRARALETLFVQHDRVVSVPAEISPSITNAEYRNLLCLAAKTAPQKHRRLVSGEKAYVVQRGDSLAGVARKHKVSPEAILAANPGLIPTRMQPGQVLVIPSVAGVTTTVPPLNKETALTSTR